MRDPWSALGIARGASRAQVKEAFRRLAKANHPDLVEASDRAAAEARFKVIAEAHQQLLRSGGGGRAAHAHDLGSAAWNSAGNSRPWSATARHNAQRESGFGNAVLAVVVTFPLILTGIHLGSRADHYADLTWRAHGIMQKPMNPYLREDLRETRVKSSFSDMFGSVEGSKGGKTPEASVA